MLLEKVELLLPGRLSLQQLPDGTEPIRPVRKGDFTRSFQGFGVVLACQSFQPHQHADTLYPLSSIVAEAVLDYLKNGRPETSDRHVFFRIIAPYSPLTYSAVSGCASRYLRKAGIPVSRPGSHTLRHTCVQRLVDAQFSLKMIGDYVGHRSTASTEIYTKVDIKTLREVALGDGKEVLA